MLRNVTGQHLTVFAFDATTNLPKTGDVANITAYVSIDDGAVTVLADTSATELDATNAKGYYLFDVAQAESNGTKLGFSAKSSTANIVVIATPAVIYTDPANYPSLSVDSSGKVLLQATQIGVTIPTVTTVTNQLTAAAIATGIFQDTTSGDFTVAGSIGKSLFTSGVVPGAAGGLFIAGANAATTVNITGSLSGSVGSISGVTFPTNFPALGISAGGHISNVDTLTTYAGNTVQTGDSFARIGLAGAGLTNLGDIRIAHLDADITSRMATFTLPTHFSLFAIDASGDVTFNNSGVATSSNQGTIISGISALGSPMQAGSTVALTTAYDAAKTAAQAGNQMDLVNAPNATAIAAIQSGLATHIDATGLATSIAALPSAAAIVTALQAAVVEGTLTQAEVTRVMLAILAGLSTGASTGTKNYYGVDGTTVRVTATVNNGDRSAVTLNGA